MDDELVEKVARAICTATGEQWREGAYPVASGPSFRTLEISADPLNNSHRHVARAAIAAMREAGWKGPDEIKTAEGLAALAAVDGLDL